MLIAALFFVFLTAAIAGYAVIPAAYTKSVTLSQRRAYTLSHKLDRIVPRHQIKTITQMYVLAPVLMAGILAMLFPKELRLFGVLLGLSGGFIFPGIYTKALIARNRRQFETQLVDALMIMSSSFRGGMSLIQAMEAVVEEMPDPIRQEFLTVLGENKMGVSLEEALNHLYYRMPSSALQQMTTAILLARETGGNLPVIFQRIVHVVREHKRIQSQIDTLTIQGKLQGIVMSLLPIVFFIIVYSAQPRFFQHMLRSQVGRGMLIYACLSELVGAYMIWKISTYRDY